MRKTLLQRNPVILTLDLHVRLKVAEAAFQPLSRLTQIQKFRTQTYYIWVRYPTKCKLTQNLVSCSQTYASVHLGTGLIQEPFPRRSIGTCTCIGHVPL